MAATGELWLLSNFGLFSHFVVGDGTAPVILGERGIHPYQVRFTDLAIGIAQAHSNGAPASSSSFLATHNRAEVRKVSPFRLRAYEMASSFRPTRNHASMMDSSTPATPDERHGSTVFRAISRLSTRIAKPKMPL